MKRFLLPLLFTLGLAGACEVPVFRFALERWPEDPLPLEVTRDASAPSPGVEAALQHLQNQVPGEIPANLTIHLLEPDSPGQIPDSMRLLAAGSRPGAPDPQVLWEGGLTESNARRLSDSPSRTAIAKQLLEGTSAVWVIVSRGDHEADDKAVKMVTRGLDRAMKGLRLPTGVIHCDEAAQRLADNPQATMDDVLRTSIPLKIAFTVLLIRSDDPEEALFRDLIAHLAPPEGAPNEPIIAPVFGRGRVLSPAPLSLIDEDRVFEGCTYLCGACACMVKQQNPGIDIPFRVNWNGHIQEHLATLDISLDLPVPETVTYGAHSMTPSAPVAPGGRLVQNKVLWGVIIAASAVLVAGLAKKWHSP